MAYAETECVYRTRCARFDPHSAFVLNKYIHCIFIVVTIIAERASPVSSIPCIHTSSSNLFRYAFQSQQHRHMFIECFIRHTHVIRICIICHSHTVCASRSRSLMDWLFRCHTSHVLWIEYLSRTVICYQLATACSKFIPLCSFARWLHNSFTSSTRIELSPKKWALSDEKKKKITKISWIISHFQYSCSTRWSNASRCCELG